MAKRWTPATSAWRSLPSGEPVIRYFDNEFPVGPAGPGQLHELLERQHYRLAWWGVAGDEINWRRFFDINGLAALRIEDPAVFEATHATLFRLYADGLIDGFRVDHVDGLSDPPGLLPPPAPAAG